jgi:hypothetical protein
MRQPTGIKLDLKQSTSKKKKKEREIIAARDSSNFLLPEVQFAFIESYGVFHLTTIL